MFKKVCLFLMCFVAGLILVSCGGSKKLSTPTNFKIENNIATWDAVENAAKYRLNFVTEDKKENKRNVGNVTTIDLSTFNLAEGKYNVYIQAVAIDGYEDSDYTTETVVYEVKPETLINTLEGEDLISNTYVKWLGRTKYDTTKAVNIMYHSASSFEVKFKGTEVEAVLYATNYLNASKRPYIVIMVDDDYENRTRIALEAEYTTLKIAQLAKDDGKVHTVSVWKSSESTDSHMGLKSLKSNGGFVEGVEFKERTIEFIAASSSTGYGNLNADTKTSSNSDAMQAFSYLTARALNADINIYSASGWGCKASAWTSPNSLNLYDAYKKVDFFSNESWDMTKITPDVIVINLGTNDWSYIKAGADVNERNSRMQAFKDQYVDFLTYLHTVYPNCKIIMLYGLMLEKDIYDATVDIYNVAKQSNPGLGIIQIFGDAKGSNSHPSLASHKAISEALIAKIKEEMSW